jgi:hypothetical protein
MLKFEDAQAIVEVEIVEHTQRSHGYRQTDVGAALKLLAKKLADAAWADGEKSAGEPDAA